MRPHGPVNGAAISVVSRARLVRATPRLTQPAAPVRYRALPAKCPHYELSRGVSHAEHRRRPVPNPVANAATRAARSRWPTRRRGMRLFRGSGTSQAAAAVFGAVALLLQRPTVAPDQIKKMLMSAAASIKNGDVYAAGAGSCSKRVIAASIGTTEAVSNSTATSRPA
jgi:hypothetical protein